MLVYTSGKPSFLLLTNIGFDTANDLTTKPIVVVIHFKTEVRMPVHGSEQHQKVRPTQTNSSRTTRMSWKDVKENKGKHELAVHSRRPKGVFNCEEPNISQCYHRFVIVPTLSLSSATRQTHCIACQHAICICLDLTDDMGCPLANRLQ